MTETIRTHLGLSCIVLGVVLVVIGALLTPGGDMYASLPYQTAGVILTVVIYLVLRLRVRRSN